MAIAIEGGVLCGGLGASQLRNFFNQISQRNNFSVAKIKVQDKNRFGGFFFSTLSEALFVYTENTSSSMFKELRVFFKLYYFHY